MHRVSEYAWKVEVKRVGKKPALSFVTKNKFDAKRRRMAYAHWDGENCWKRNLLFRFGMPGTWMVWEPDCELKTCGETLADGIQGWEKEKGKPPFWMRAAEVDEKAYEKAKELAPEKKWLLKAWWECGSRHLAEELMACLMAPPETEMLWKIGAWKLATSRAIWKLSREQKRKLARMLVSQHANPTPKQAMLMMKWGCDENKAIAMVETGSRTPKELRWKRKHGVGKWQYKRYVDLAKELLVDMEDDYWRYPSDFQKRWEKLERRRNERKREQRRLEIEKAKKLHEEVLKKLGAKVAVKGWGMVAWVPTKEKEIERQARILDQCLIRCSYDMRHFEGKEMLVFVCDKDGTPKGTFLIDEKTGRTIQATTDQHNDEWEPTANMKRLVARWKKVNLEKIAQ